MLQSNNNYYQEITLLPYQEINLNFLMGKIFNSLHLLFVKNQEMGIVKNGISFPEYNKENKTLGTKIRIFYDSIESCNKMNLKEYLKAFADYIHITNSREVPKNVNYAIFKRVQCKGSKNKLARRYAKRNNISYDKAITLYDKYIQNINNLPYIKLKSSSNENRYTLHIEKNISKKQENTFNTFGLSNNSSVPIF